MKNYAERNITPLISFSDLLERFPCLALVARELRLPYATVASWRRRNFVPAGYWGALVDYARRQKLQQSITMDSLRRLGEQHDAGRVERAREIRAAYEAKRRDEQVFQKEI